jgi:hypothetical protein
MVSWQGRKDWDSEDIHEKRSKRMAVSVNTALDPWRVLSSLLLSKTSDEVVHIIDLTGLRVDWALENNQNYSHMMRIRAYMPRIMAAYDSLFPDDKARVSYVVARELVSDSSTLDALNERLAPIGWRMEANQLVPIDAPVVEMFFGPGTPHDSYKAIRDVFYLATSSIAVIDAYANGLVFELCASIPNTNQIHLKILGSRFPQDFQAEAQRFTQQYGHFRLEIRASTDFHDRFVVIDDVHCYYIGASIKDAGKRSFFMGKIQDPKNVTALLEQFKTTWDLTSPI